ncbi:MAG: nuclear transport factor 2 family protein [Gammaproteobacteria bacterium]
MSRESALQQIAAARGSLARETIEAKVRQFLATYAARDWELRASLLSEDVIFEDTVGVPPPAVGRAAAAEYFQIIINMNWHIEMKPRHIIVMGNEAFSITRAQWGVEGEQPAKLILIHNFKFNPAGEISHVRIAYDEGCLED